MRHFELFRSGRCSGSVFPLPARSSLKPYVSSADGLICTLETYKDKIKMTFAKGASMNDPAKLFNGSLEASVRRAIDLREDDQLDKRAFKALIQEAVRVNRNK